jgi:hypothetical protein
MTYTEGKKIAISTYERETLYEERLKAISDFCRRHYLEDPGPWDRPAGLRAVLRVLGRTSEGHLRARVVITAPQVRGRYVRDLRVVSSPASSVSRPLELRLA